LRELKILLSIKTDCRAQEVVDRLLDGTIHLAGKLESVTVEEGHVRKDYTPEDYR